jgi:hypothetical protein
VSCVLAGRFSLASSPRHHAHHLLDDFNPDGSSLLLRPSAPVYCCDLDPAALGGVGTHTPQPSVAAPGGSSFQLPSQPSQLSQLSQPLGGVTGSASDGPAAAAGAVGGLQGGGGFVGPDVTLLGASAGVAGIGSRCGYRADGFGPPNHKAAYVPQGAHIPGPSAAAAAGGVGLSAGGIAGVPVLQLTVPPMSEAAGKSETECIPLLTR